MRYRLGFPILAVLALGACSPALAHTTERAVVLTLPTDLYILGGVIVVAVSFLLVGLVPPATVRSFESALWRGGRFPPGVATVLSLTCLAATGGLVLAGRFGTQDPLANPLPLAVWTLWWIGLTMAHALFGNLWAALNPWHGLHTLLLRAPGLGRWLRRPPLRYPAWLGYWPAWAQFFAFAWYELIFVVPRNPQFLAEVVSLYFTANLLAVLLFGRETWLRYGETFSVFFRVVSWLSPLGTTPDGERGRLYVASPGAMLLHVRNLPLSGVAFVLLVLASVSFDGLSKTYWWLGNIGINPLDFPGRSAVALHNTLGLLAVFAVLAGAFATAVWLGHRLTGRPANLSESLGATVVSIVPIAFGYHFAHYLTIFLVDVQYAAITFNDPLGLGWDLLGLAGTHVTTSFLTDYDSVRLIWHSQVAGIVFAHVMAVSIAHFIAARHCERRSTAIVSQLPLTVLMVAYTQFGLWLLSTAAIG